MRQRWPMRAACAAMLLSMSLPAPVHAQPCDGEWVTFPRTALAGGVRSLVWFDDGSGRGSELYASGFIVIPPPHTGEHVARWDGDEWIAIDAGIPRADGGVYDLAVFDADGAGPGLEALYLGTQESGLLKWNGTAWSPAGDVCGPVRCLRVFDDGTGPALYIGGAPRQCGSRPASVIKWQDGVVTPLGDFSVGLVNAMHLERGPNGAHVYVTGAAAGALWDGASWTEFDVPEYLGGEAIIRFDDGTGKGTRLFVGGHLSRHGLPAEQVLVWNGDQWDRVGLGLGGEQLDIVQSLFIERIDGVDRLVAGGRFDFSGDIPVLGFAVWDGQSWTRHPAQLIGAVEATAGPGPHDEPHVKYYGGSFFHEGDPAAISAGRWDGAELRALGFNRGLSTVVSAFHFTSIGNDPPALFVGGSFWYAGNAAASGIARLQENTWSALGSGVSGVVRALATYQHPVDAVASLVVAGGFMEAGGLDAANIARWDGSEWHDLAHGLFSPDGTGSAVSALAMYDEGKGPRLFAAGNFQYATTIAPSNRVNNIARWDGTSWSSVGGGANAAISRLQLFDAGDGPSLYAFGHFSVIGGVGASGIARWDGTQWISVTNPLHLRDFAHVTTSTVGGRPRLFVTANAQVPGSLFAFNGVGWEVIHLPFCGEAPCGINAISELEDDYGIGLIADIDTVPGGAPKLVRWHGAQWTPFPDNDGISIYSNILARSRTGGRETLWVGNPLIFNGQSTSRLAAFVACPSCRPDWNLNGVLDSADFFAFLEDFFAAGSGTLGDFNRSGTTDSQDFFDFVAAFFAGCL